MGNDLAGGKVFSCPDVVNEPSACDQSDVSKLFSSAFPACEVICGQSQKFRDDVDLSDSFLVSESTPTECKLSGPKSVSVVSSAVTSTASSPEVDGLVKRDAQISLYILTALPPAGPTNPRPAQEPSAPQINLYISGIPQQDKINAVELLKQAPLQHLVVANPESPPGLPYPAPYNSILPQNTLMMPVSMPFQAFPHMVPVPPQVSPLQSSTLLGPQVNPYLQPVNHLLGPQNFGPSSFYPQMYPFKPYGNYGVPNIAISPPIIFRECGQTATTQV
ncbi:uncharacterized protein LOC127431058 [Myxocyprinus asiaticus]|uniref:uncharacterized protein LOC127431058 n=1 Tax=Myxocyprinus asiaticus TaxID=70543 RepID=UPI002223AA37|nr:uncharacterized protein LOC127431058 [Myxocyprinus asiaticus]